MPRPIRLIVIHCSASPNARTLFSGRYGEPGFRTPVMEIDAWHTARDFRRESYWRGRQNPSLESIGYHFVIARNGALFTGRHEDEPGAHAEHWNASSLGICLVGTDAFTPQQWLQLKATVEGLCWRYEIDLAAPKLVIQGHRQHIVVRPGVCGHGEIPSVDKACPGFSVADWLASGLAPMAAHLSPAPEPTP